MNRYLKEINRNIMISNDKFATIWSEYKEIKQELEINKQFKVVGSFEKGLMTKKTEDVDIDIIVVGPIDKESTKSEATYVKQELVDYFKDEGGFHNGKVSIEYNTGNFIYSFTVVVDNTVRTYKVIYCENSNEVNKIISKQDKGQFLRLLNTEKSKRQKWMARKFVRIMVYLLEESRHNLPKYQLETILLNELIPNEKKTNVNEKFEAFKKFFEKLGNNDLKDSLINLMNKNEDAYKSLTGRAKHIFNAIENKSLREFAEWMKNHY